jgi:outer membrane lipopolysaccharide assembly protein LptE/RlpB
MRYGLLALAAVVLSGCAGYTLGPIKPTPFRDVQTLCVTTFRNNTLEPRIEMLVTNTVIKQIQQDGTYRIVREDQADALLEGTITKLERRATRSLRGNVLATREFQLTIEINYKVTKPKTGEVLDERTVIGTTSFFVGRDVQQDERQAIPLAAEEAAVRLVSQISEGW